ncbi:unnamed protein product [Orchesella dallaii]|uniref:tRNA wybutosine-synthesizing protein 3 homolog n=1 Tax=Orchesella dallaii TaxID=48710 RepID=A0ABP1Q5R5_9HEXA
MSDNQRRKMAHAKKQGGNTELINVRFYENQQRQALTTSDLAEGEEGADLSSVTQVREDVPFDTEMNPAAVTTAAGSLLTPTQEEQDSKRTLHNKTQTENVANVGVDVDPFGTSLTAPDSETNETSTDSTTRVSSSFESLQVSAPTDKSRKGSVDQRIWKLVNLINSQKDAFFTTSSCSGRIILYTWKTGESIEVGEETYERNKGQKKGCRWLLVSHEEVKADALQEAYFAYDGKIDSYFKMEPCILHVQCRTLSDARKLIHIATESGFRNSGMVIGKENRITVAIRSAMGLEIPLPPTQGQLSGSEVKMSIKSEYLKYIVQIANEKMRENWTRSEKLTKLFADNWK